MSSGYGSAAPIRRIQRELKEISESPSRHWTAGPIADDMFEWQFAVRGPPGTEFEGGIYTGRIALPVNYPLAPPSITLLTPSGRWEVGKKICLSNTNYHAETWQPAWGIRTMMEALRSHFPVPGEGAIAALEWPSDLRRKLAQESLDFVCVTGKRNRELLPELSPEEVAEDGPEPVPESLRPGGAQQAPAPPPAEGVGSPAPPPPEEPAAPQLAEGLRQRHGGAATAAPSSWSHAPEEATSAPSASGSTEAAPATPTPVRNAVWTMGGDAEASGDASASSPQRRRTREGARQQRRPQRPLLVQLVKPPANGRGWLVLLIDLLVALLAVSALLVLVDMIKDPPTLLEPLGEKEPKAE